MLDYLVQWGHMYVVHIGAWVTFGFGATIYKNGMPPLSEVPSMLKTAIILALILAIFSSHSHHYLANILPKM